MGEANFEQCEKVISVVFEVVRSVGEETLEDVEATEDWVEIRVLQKLPHAGFESGPCVVLFSDDATGNLTDSVSDVLLHVQIGLRVYGKEEIGLYFLLNFDSEGGPYVGVCGGGVLREAEADLRGWEIAALEWCIA